MTNSNILHLKVPVNIQAPISTLKCYCAYLWFKTRSGELELNSAYKNRNYYWVRKLYSCGFLIQKDGVYRLKSYQEVWRLMGVERVNKTKNFKGFRYFKIYCPNPDTFLKDALDQILKHIVERKKKQIAKRLALGLHRKVDSIRKTETVQFSCQSTAKLLGYRSDTSGYDYRMRYFKVIFKKRERIEYLKPNGLKFYRNPCNYVRLD